MNKNCLPCTHVVNWKFHEVLIQILMQYAYLVQPQNLVLQAAVCFYIKFNQSLMHYGEFDMFNARHRGTLFFFFLLSVQHRFYQSSYRAKKPYNKCLHMHRTMRWIVSYYIRWLYKGSYVTKVAFDAHKSQCRCHAIPQRMA